MNTNDHSNEEIVDLQEYAKSGKEIPRGRTYRFKVDKNQYETRKEELTGKEILQLAGKTPPEKFLLRQKIGSQVIDIALNEEVSLLKSGVERFMTIPNEVTEGEGSVARREFVLSDEDLGYLNTTSLTWEAVLEGTNRRIIFHDWPIPNGYNIQRATVHVRLESGYPDTQIDMAYFSPPLMRGDNKPINNLTEIQFQGSSWQQWSRHRTSLSAWRIGEDNLGTHMALVANWLDTELTK